MKKENEKFKPEIKKIAERLNEILDEMVDSMEAADLSEIVWLLENKF